MSSSTFLDESDEYKCIYDYLTYGEYPAVARKSMKREIRRRATKYVVNGQMLFVTNGNETKRVVCTDDERTSIMRACHEGVSTSKEARALGGHFGRDKTYQKVNQSYYWKMVSNDVSEYVRISLYLLVSHKCYRNDSETIPFFQRVPYLLHEIHLFIFFKVKTCTKCQKTNPPINKSAPIDRHMFNGKHRRNLALTFNVYRSGTYNCEILNGNRPLRGFLTLDAGGFLTLQRDFIDLK